MVDTKKLTEDILLAAPDLGARLFRNNTGVARHQGRNGSVQVVRYGVGPTGGGGSDLIGWKSVVITPDMVGQRVAIFAAPEIKNTGDRLRENQDKWLRWVRDAGGISGVVGSVEDAIALLK